MADEHGEWLRELDANVVPFPSQPVRRNELEAALEELPVRTADDMRGPEACRHRRSLVSGAARTVTCRDCGCPLDAVDVLLQLAHSRERLVKEGAFLRADVEHKRAQLAEAERLERNAKARLRAARSKLPVEVNGEGWPLCPSCGGDTLANRGYSETPTIPNPLGELHCHRCRKVTLRGGRVVA